MKMQSCNKSCFPYLASRLQVMSRYPLLQDAIKTSMTLEIEDVNHEHITTIERLRRRAGTFNVPNTQERLPQVRAPALAPHPADRMIAISSRISSLRSKVRSYPYHTPSYIKDKRMYHGVGERAFPVPTVCTGLPDFQ